MHSSPDEQNPCLVKNQHSGILLRLYSCRNSQSPAFLHSPRSQCLHTVLLCNDPPVFLDEGL